MSRSRVSDPDSIQVIARAADVLRCVAAQAEGISLSELARRTGLARSTAQRIVKSLEDEAFLEPLHGRPGFRLGSGLHALLGHEAVDVAGVAEPFLRALSMAVDETVDLSILDGSRARFVSHIEGRHRLAAVSAVGMRFPLHSTANGKALLSSISPRQREAMLAPILSPETARAMTVQSDLLAEIDRIAETGIAFDIEEHTEGVCAIGTAFLDGSGRAYAISIPVPQQRFVQKESELAAPLLRCRDQIIEAVGGKSAASHA